MHGDTILSAARILWGFLKLTHRVHSADFILCLGSHDTQVAVLAASLWKQALASHVVLSGGLAHQGDVLDTGWNRPEADVFAEIAHANGVPEGQLIIERTAQNTGENFQLTRHALRERGLRLSSCIAVAKPYMTRRGFLTGRRVWPELTLAMQCENIEFDVYIAREENRGITIDAMVGDLHRILVYPQLGLQVADGVPAAVVEAMKVLVDRGFVRRLIPGYSLKGERL